MFKILLWMTSIFESVRNLHFQDTLKSMYVNKLSGHPKQTNFSSGVFYFSPIDVIILVGYNIALVRALLLIEQQL